MALRDHRSRRQTAAPADNKPAAAAKTDDSLHGDGGYSVVEAAITIPAIILMTMIVVQYALLWHGRNVAESAARDGLDAARAFEASPQAGQEAARSYLADVAPTLLTGPDVNVTRTATTVRVQVQARVLRVIPVGQYTVSETVVGPIERFVSQPGRAARCC